MALPDYYFTDGFDKYAKPQSQWDDATPNPFYGIWSLFSDTGDQRFVDPIGAGATGAAFQIGTQNGTFGGLIRSFGWNCPRIIGGIHLKLPLLGTFFIVFGDGLGTWNLYIRIRPTGVIQVVRGTPDTGTILATAAETVSTTVFCLEWDITFNSTTGRVKLWVNGVPTSVDLTGQNTVNTGGNAFFSRFALSCSATVGASAIVDHLYMWGYSTAGGTETPALTNPQIETQFPVSDYSIDSTFVRGTIGDALVSTPPNNVATGAANVIRLRKCTVDTNCTLNAVCWVPGQSTTAKSRPVVYSDNAGLPDVLLADGPEVTGATNQIKITLALTSPLSLTAGVDVWIGFMIDVSTAQTRTDTNSNCYQISRTYGLGPQDPAGSGTFTTSFYIYGEIEGPAATFGQLNEWPLGGSNFNAVYLDNALQEDLFNFPAITINADTIYGVQVGAAIKREVPGPRFVDLRMLSNVTYSNGSADEFSPAPEDAIYLTAFQADPDTTLSWSASGINAAKTGYRLAT